MIKYSFPVNAISTECSREKSIRQGHISTLQMWWARRPLAVCRAAIFAALIPEPKDLTKNSEFTKQVNNLIPGKESPEVKLYEFTSRLSSWDACNDEQLLSIARQLIITACGHVPTVLDTFAGGGSFPLEGLRLGLDAIGSDLNPVAVTSLVAALELLPTEEREVIQEYRRAAEELLEHVSKVNERLYELDSNEKTLALFWSRTFECPNCNFETPLTKNWILASSKKKICVDLRVDAQSKRPNFFICTDPTAADWRNASRGTVGAQGACCVRCEHKVSTNWLMKYSCEIGFGDLLYAKRVLNSKGIIEYKAATDKDRLLAQKASMRSISNRKIKEVPSELFDVNGVRHIWTMQYGIRSTADLFNRRQQIALLELAHEISESIIRLQSRKGMSNRRRKAISVLLALTFNRILMYNSKHSWWQPNGEFPANIFVRQAIPMVWNYVEIPTSSPAAGGIESAANWISMVAEHCRKLPKTGSAKMADAAKVDLPSKSVDLITLDPPYYDSIVYAYLADVFYVWMKPLLENIVPGLFGTNVILKSEEAIVDRPHTMATALKDDAHFRRKMTESLQEAKRLLKPSGKLLLMFGHKGAHAWDAIITALFDAGFTPVASWPVHTERKSKLRHGHIAALSSSCLIVCEPKKSEPSDTVTWQQFSNHLKVSLSKSLAGYKENHFYGADLVAATMAPALCEFKKYEHVREKAKDLSTKDFLNRLPRLIAEIELESILRHDSLVPYAETRNWLEKASTTDVNNEWLTIQAASAKSKDKLMTIATKYSDALLEGIPAKADKVWQSLSTFDQEAARVFFEALSLLSPEASQLRQRADASLGRIAMHLRGAELNDDAGEEDDEG